jgi:hypothetical protein
MKAAYLSGKVANARMRGGDGRERRSRDRVPLVNRRRHPMGDPSGRGLRLTPKAMCSVRRCERARRGDEEVARPITEFRDFEIFSDPVASSRTPLRNPRSSSPGPPPHGPRLFKAPSNAFVAEEKALGDAGYSKPSRPLVHASGSERPDLEYWTAPMNSCYHPLVSASYRDVAYAPQRIFMRTRNT